MSGGMATYRVVEPLFPWELFARLMQAATLRKNAEFEAESVDDANIPPLRKVFTVKVNSAQFDAPAAFDVTDDEGHMIQIKLPEFGPVEFFLYP